MFYPLHYFPSGEQLNGQEPKQDKWMLPHLLPDVHACIFIHFFSYQVLSLHCLQTWVRWWVHDLCKLPRKVSYKRTFGMSNQGQMLDVWEIQTAESALRWPTRYLAPRHNLEFTLEVILELVLGIKTMSLVFNPGSLSKSLSLPENYYRRESHDLIPTS